MQAMAWVLKLDMMIIDTSGSKDSPYYLIEGNLIDGNHGCKELIYIGSKSNQYYQSLLELEGNEMEQNTTVHENENEVNKLPEIIDPKAKGYKVGDKTATRLQKVE